MGKGCGDTRRFFDVAESEVGWKLPGTFSVCCTGASRGRHAIQVSNPNWFRCVNTS